MVSGASRAFVSCLAGLLVGGILFPSIASACRVPLRPAALRALKADAIVLVKIIDAKSSGYDWTATATVEGRLFGPHPKPNISFGNGGTVTSCGGMGAPKPDRFYVLYLQRTAEGLKYQSGYPFWFARTSGDPRLAKLNKLKPLGLAREPTTDEQQLIDLVEPRVLTKSGMATLFGYTQVYGRSSASWISVMLIRSRSSRRLIVDDPAEFPTVESCRCRPIELLIQADDLWAAGKLPPFDP
jgi:hypothetical protein